MDRCMEIKVFLQWCSQNPGEIRRGRCSWVLIAGWIVLLLSWSSTAGPSVLVSVFVMFCTAAETAISRVHKLLHTGGVPTSLTLLFWWWPVESFGLSGLEHRDEQFMGT